MSAQSPHNTQEPTLDEEPRHEDERSGQKDESDKSEELDESSEGDKGEEENEENEENDENEEDEENGSEGEPRLTGRSMQFWITLGANRGDPCLRDGISGQQSQAAQEAQPVQELHHTQEPAPTEEDQTREGEPERFGEIQIGIRLNPRERNLHLRDIERAQEHQPPQDTLSIQERHPTQGAQTNEDRFGTIPIYLCLEPNEVDPRSRENQSTQEPQPAQTTQEPRPTQETQPVQGALAREGVRVGTIPIYLCLDANEEDPRRRVDQPTQEPQSAQSAAEVQPTQLLHSVQAPIPLQETHLNQEPGLIQDHQPAQDSYNAEELYRPPFQHSGNLQPPERPQHPEDGHGNAIIRLLRERMQHQQARERQHVEQPQPSQESQGDMQLEIPSLSLNANLRSPERHQRPEDGHCNTVFRAIREGRQRQLVRERQYAELSQPAQEPQSGECTNSPRVRFSAHLPALERRPRPYNVQGPSPARESQPTQEPQVGGEIDHPRPQFPANMRPSGRQARTEDTDRMRILRQLRQEHQTRQARLGLDATMVDIRTGMGDLVGFVAIMLVSVVVRCACEFIHTTFGVRLSVPVAMLALLWARRNRRMLIILILGWVLYTWSLVGEIFFSHL
jgi:hypothetical protein